VHITPRPAGPLRQDEREPHAFSFAKKATAFPQDVTLHLHHAELLAQRGNSARSSVMSPVFAAVTVGARPHHPVRNTDAVTSRSSRLGDGLILVEHQLRGAGFELVGEFPTLPLPARPVFSLRFHLGHSIRLSKVVHGSGSSPDGVSLVLHIGEFALQQVAFLNDRTYCAKKRVAGRKARAAEYTRELGTYLGAHYELSAAHLLPLYGERPSALRRHTATLHDVAQTTPWSSNSKASAADSPSVGAVDVRAVRARWISCGSKNEHHR